MVSRRGRRIQGGVPNPTHPKRQGILATDFLQRFEMLETLKYPVLVSNIQRTSVSFTEGLGRHARVPLHFFGARMDCAQVT